jgi:restriction system protein
MLRVVASLGGSARGSEIVEALIASLEVTPEQLAVTYPGRPRSVLIDRMDWARSYAKLGGALDSPQRGLFVLSSLGKHILSLPEKEGRAQVEKLDRTVRAERRRRAAAAGQEGPVRPGEDKDIEAHVVDSDAESDDSWKESLLARLHRLSPTGFENFCL